MLSQNEENQNEEKAEKASQKDTGTWVSIPQNIISEGEWYNLHEEENYLHQFRIPVLEGSLPIDFTFRKKEEPAECLKHWLAENEYEALFEPLE